MKIKTILYIISIIFIVTSMLLVVEFPNSGRMNVIAGVIAPLGIILNIAACILSCNSKNSN